MIGESEFLNGHKTSEEGIIFNIQRYSIHDGPGIRTTIFLKGCPLRCKWCSNPESYSSSPEIFFRTDKCDYCGKCLEVCSPKAISISENSIEIDRDLCDLCLKCEEICHNGVINCTGKKVSVKEVVLEAMQDEMFYNNSGGGITISGGEPLFQPKFTLNLLKEFKEKSIHTTIDTTGYAAWKDFNEILNYTDLLLYDIKHLNSEIHLKYTGVRNELILKNFENILKKGSRIWIRVPVIPSFNDSIQFMNELGKFLTKKPIEKVSVLPYHEWGKHKYKYLGRVYPLSNAQFIDEKIIQDFKKVLDSYDLNVTTDY
jgi:pyruvate formate lyase activating enzyme